MHKKYLLLLSLLICSDFCLCQLNSSNSPFALGVGIFHGSVNTENLSGYKSVYSYSIGFDKVLTGNDKRAISVGILFGQSFLDYSYSSQLILGFSSIDVKQNGFAHVDLKTESSNIFENIETTSKIRINFAKDSLDYLPNDTVSVTTLYSYNLHQIGITVNFEKMFGKKATKLVIGSVLNPNYMWYRTITDKYSQSGVTISAFDHRYRYFQNGGLIRRFEVEESKLNLINENLNKIGLDIQLYCGIKVNDAFSLIGVFKTPLINLSSLKETIYNFGIAARFRI